MIDFKKPVTIDRTSLQENIATGQRIIKASLEFWDGNRWKQIQEFTTVGYKRLLRFKPVTSQKMRLTILDAKAVVQLAEIGFYKASPEE